MSKWGFGRTARAVLALGISLLLCALTLLGVALAEVVLTG